jgi:hypothetical protein
MALRNGGSASAGPSRIQARWRAVRDAWATRGAAELDAQLDDALARDDDREPWRGEP